MLQQFGLFPKLLLNSLKGIIPFFKNYFGFRKKNKKDPEFRITTLLPNFHDRYGSAGEIPLHYFHQDILVAQKIFNANPEKHVDIGSRIDGFVSILASFRDVEVFDIRPFDLKVLKIKFIRADLMNDNFSITNYTDSVSCLHAIEHFGLGRYGDKLDPNGHLKGLDNIYKMLIPNGKFYFSTLIGPQRIEYDAHRIFSVKYLLDYFSRKYKIQSFSYVNDGNEIFKDVELTNSNIEKNFGCNYGCGIFELLKS
jgi:SAM-dependent methyltransferase